MLDLYGKSEARLAMPGGGEAVAAVRATARTDDADSIWRLNVPGYGWRKVRFPELREIIAGNRARYVILKGDERASLIP